MVHNIAELRERFKNLLDTLCNDYHLGAYVNGDTSSEDLDCEWKDYDNAANDLGIWTACGATKFVIGDDNCDYIIKFCPREEGYDYCAREVEIYEEAKEYGYGDKFAWCAHLFDYGFNEYTNLDVYVMEWCKCGYDMIDDEMDDYHFTKYCASHNIDKKADGAYDEYDSKDRFSGEHDERVMEWAFSVWGLDYHNPEHYGICNFMRMMRINDIHAGNWGWCDNRLVLTDYSGYGEDEECRSINY
jgi:hypothetical protein